MSRRKLCRLTPAQLRLLLGEINEQTEGGGFSRLAPGSTTGSFLRRCAGAKSSSSIFFYPWLRLFRNRSNSMLTIRAQRFVLDDFVFRAGEMRGL